MPPAAAPARTLVEKDSFLRSRWPLTATPRSPAAESSLLRCGRPLCGGARDPRTATLSSPCDASLAGCTPSAPGPSAGCTARPRALPPPLTALLVIRSSCSLRAAARGSLRTRVLVEGREQKRGMFDSRACLSYLQRVLKSPGGPQSALAAVGTRPPLRPELLFFVGCLFLKFFPPARRLLFSSLCLPPRQDSCLILLFEGVFLLSPLRGGRASTASL